MAAGESARVMAQSLRDQAAKLHADAANWDAGATGEERVADLLTTAEGQSFRVLHDRLLDAGRSEANLDHVVVSTAGLFLIDTKNWIGDSTFYNESLWQHWTSPEGRQSANKKLELDKIRGMATRFRARSNHSVVPLLCLAGDGGSRFGLPREVRGVQVVPIEHLLSWLQHQPPIWTPEVVATNAVDLSALFPPAVNAGLTIHEFAAGAPCEDALRAARPVPIRPPKPAKRPRPASPQPSRAAKLVFTLVALIALAVLAPTLARMIGNRIEHSASSAISPTSMPKPAPTLSAARARALDDWRIRAGLYKSNDQPSAIAYVSDASLGSWSDSCRDQLRELRPFRPGLLHAPDHELAAAAARFDRAARHQLQACITNHVVALHHARGAMEVAAAEVNTRYNRLIGNDPLAPTATRVL